MPSRFTNAQNLVLKNEILTDPNAYGYATPWGNGADNAVADILNVKRDGSNGGPAITRKRSNITANEILQAIAANSYSATANSTQLAAFQAALAQSPNIQLFNEDDSPTRVKDLLDVLVANTLGSQTRVNALGSRAGSRAEQILNLSGVTITADDISYVRLAQ